MNIPDYVLLEEDIYELDFHLPDPCTEHNPHGPIELLEDYNDRYNQLILWCMIQSYWFYVVNNPQVTDMEYDYVKKYIKLLETGEDLGTEEGEVYETLKLPHEPLGFSPTRRGFNPISGKENRPTASTVDEGCIKKTQ
jgi:hypothetical protein